MKSSGRKVVASRFVTFVGLTLALALGFTVVNQGNFATKGKQESVLGTLSSHTTNVTKSLNGVNYQCQRTDCDSVENMSAWEQNALNKSQGDTCEAVTDRTGKNVCYWNTDYFTTHQCNVDKTTYRNQSTDNGALNLYFSGGSENVVYYNCTKIALTPTRVPPTAIPTKRPTPTPPCIGVSPTPSSKTGAVTLPDYKVKIYWNPSSQWGKGCPYNMNGYRVTIEKADGGLVTQSPFLSGATRSNWTTPISLQSGSYIVKLEVLNDGGKSNYRYNLQWVDAFSVVRPTTTGMPTPTKRPADPKPTAAKPTPTKAAPYNVR